jgi:peptide methionine sulfoxide reductase MsrB
MFTMNLGKHAWPFLCFEKTGIALCAARQNRLFASREGRRREKRKRRAGNGVYECQVCGKHIMKKKEGGDFNGWMTDGNACVGAPKLCL